MSLADLPTAQDWIDLDALAEYFAENLLLDHDADAPLPWAVWCDFDGNDGMGDREIIGAGETPTAAIDEARETLRKWEEKARAAS